MTTHTTNTGYVHANGIDIYYQERGAGVPFVLLHGGTATSDSWQGFMPALAEHFRVITPDTRGHGNTKNPSGELQYGLLADDVAAFIEALGLEKPLLGGYSDGGHITLEVGVRYPDIARALVIGGTFLRVSDSFHTVLREEWGIEGPYEVDFARTEKNMAEGIPYWKKAHAAQGDGDYWKTLIRAVSGMWLNPPHYSAKDFEKVTVPALVVVGDRDKMAPLPQAVEMYDLLPQGEIAVIPNATHENASSTPDEENPLFLQILLAFLKRQVE